MAILLVSCPQDKSACFCIGFFVYLSFTTQNLITENMLCNWVNLNTCHSRPRGRHSKSWMNIIILRSGQHCLSPMALPNWPVLTKWLALPERHGHACHCARTIPH